MYKSGWLCLYSQYIISESFTDGFLVQVGLNHDSVLSLLLFFINLESLSREIRFGCPEKMSYADVLILVGETLYSLKERLEARKETL